MRSLFCVTKPPRKGPVFLHEYQSHRIKLHGLYFCCSDNITTLFVVFDGETQRHFSAVKVVLYSDVSRMSIDAWKSLTIKRPVESVTVPQNNPALPQLTVAFKVVPRNDIGVYYDLLPPSSVDELQCRHTKAVRILLESTQSTTPGALSVSVSFHHSELLRTTSNQLYPYTFCDHNLSSPEYETTRTVRVIPLGGARPRITIRCLPLELLIKIFDASDSCAWQYDLLSFAQVSRRWAQCSMRVLFVRLESPEWKDYCSSFPTQSLDPCAFAKAFTETPALGLGIQHLHIDQHNGSLACYDHNTQEMSSGFTQALISILRTTKDLQRLHLSQGYSPQANALFSVLPRLCHLRALSITYTTCKFSSIPPRKYWSYSISTTQLAHCMACWPTLSSLTVEYLIPNIGMGRIFLRRPTCALTHLCIRNSTISVSDLLFLTASSANTLAQVTLDNVMGITDDGLHDFLNTISGNVTSLIIRNIRDAEYPRRGKEETALDAVVVKMRCLQALDICGDVASERMLRRRSEMFMRNCGEGIPVVVLSFQFVPGIKDCTGDGQAGWEVRGV